MLISIMLTVIFFVIAKTGRELSIVYGIIS